MFTIRFLPCLIFPGGYFLTSTDTMTDGNCIIRTLRLDGRWIFVDDSFRNHQNLPTHRQKLPVRIRKNDSSRVVVDGIIYDSLAQ